MEISTWIFLFVFLLRTQGALTMESAYNITVPRNYTVFKGELSINMPIYNGESLPQGAELQLIDIKHNHVMQSFNVEGYNMDISFTLTCGIIDHAGEYVARLLQRDTGEMLARSEIIFAYWPQIQMEIPENHKTLEKEITMRFFSHENLCDSSDVDSFYLQMVQYKVGYDGSPENSAVINNSPPHLMERHNISKISQIINTHGATFQCSSFDLEGVYQAQFVSVKDQTSPISVSNLMTVSWSEKYKVENLTRSVFPCSSSLSVSFSRPQCAGDDDKIRMFKMKTITASSFASPTNLVYTSEVRVSKFSTLANFDCGLFHEDTPGYCFKYVSIARNQAVTVQAQMCIPTTNQPDIVVNGGWTEWSRWGDCSTTCGNGQMHRVRSCTNPTPTWGGSYCEGDPMEFQNCNRLCDHADVSTIDPNTPFEPIPGCECGCDIVVEKMGRIIGSDLCRGSSRWNIHSKEKGKAIRLSFQLFTLKEEDPNTWLKVRNGALPTSDLILNRIGGPLPDPVQSTSPSMMVEFLAPYEEHGQYKTGEGFIAVYQAVDYNFTEPLFIPGAPSNPAWIGIVTVIGIGVFALVIVLTIIFVCHHRYTRDKDKQKTPQATESLLVNGSIPNSPSHVSQLKNGVHGSNNAVFAEGLASPSKRDYVIAVGDGELDTKDGPSGLIVTTSPSKQKLRSPTKNAKGLPYSIDSPGHKVKQARSPGYATVHDLPSPYGANAKRKDYIHDPDTFRADVHVGDPSTRKTHHPKHHRQSRQSPSAAPLQDQQSSQPHYNRNHSFEKAISPSNGHVPLADEEDLSPVSPSSPVNRSINSTSTRFEPSDYESINPRELDSSGEHIQLDMYGRPMRNRDSGIADTNFSIPSPGSADSQRQYERPPVEGMDSPHRRQSRRTADRSRPKLGPVPPVTQTAPLPNKKPTLQPLPLRGVQRPDGQSPENHHQEDTSGSKTPSSMDLSPILRKSELFEDDTKSHTSPFDQQPDEYEYDDYMPALPGSILTMDPGAYTLTWSNRAPWDPNKMAPAPGKTGVKPAADSNVSHA